MQGRDDTPLLAALGEVDKNVTREQISAAERSIYEMLVQDCPDMPDDERRRLANLGARQAAAIHSIDKEIGRETVILCVCGEAQSRHVGRSGRCKEPTCSCEAFVPDRVKLETQH
jgi:hypothetical protein